VIEGASTALNDSPDGGEQTNVLRFQLPDDIEEGEADVDLEFRNPGALRPNTDPPLEGDELTASGSVDVSETGEFVDTTTNEDLIGPFSRTIEDGEIVAATGSERNQTAADPDVISGQDAVDALGAEQVEALGGQAEAAAELSEALNVTEEEAQAAAEAEAEATAASDSETETETESVPEDISSSSITRDRPDPTSEATDAEVQASREIDQAVGRANRDLSGRREAAEERAQAETFGDIPIQNPATGNRVQDDLDTIAGGFEDAAETAFANLGRVQPTPGTLGVGGTRTGDETTEGIRGSGLEGFIDSINAAEVARGAQEAAEFAVERGDEIGQEVLEPTADLLAGNEIDTSTELRRDLAGEGERAVEAAQENPSETAASAIGGGVGGFAGGFAAARGARGVLRGARNTDIDIDATNIADTVADARDRGPGTSAITGGDVDLNDVLPDGGPRRFRQRREPGRDLPDEQEQIERTEQIEREREQDQEPETVGEDQLEELARRQGVADDVSEIEQQARSRLPPEREFGTDAEFQRELERAMRDVEQQRRDAQTDTDSGTDTATSARTRELTAGAVDGLSDGFGGLGQVTVETEPEIPRVDITPPQTTQRSGERQQDETTVGVVGGGAADGTLETTQDPQQSDDTGAEMPGVNGVIDGLPGGQQTIVDEDIAADVGVGVGVQDELSVGEQIEVGAETGTQIEIGSQDEVSVQDEIGTQIEIGSQTEIGAQTQASAQDTTGQQITDTPSETPGTQRTPAPPLPEGDDDDDEEPIFERLFQGVQAVDATLETQEVDFE
jgi:hypothetical protein